MSQIIKNNITNISYTTLNIEDDINNKINLNFKLVMKLIRQEQWKRGVKKK